MSVQLTGVAFVYPSGVRALDGVNVEIATGEVVAIVGENGAGKTTLVKLLNALLRPTEGQVLVDGWDTAAHTTAALARKVGFLYQNPDEQLFERNALQEVSYGPRNLKLEDADRRSRAALAQVGLADEAETNPYDLPPTQRKMLALAATLAMGTPVVVLDEPTIGQDAAGRDRIAAIIEGLQTEERTVLVISHDLDFCARVATRALAMANGKVLADGPIAEVFAQEDLLAKAALFAPQLVRLAHRIGMPASPLDVPQFVAAYKEWRGEERS